jgi:DNA-binding transcriptional ArsR family regulator
VANRPKLTDSAVLAALAHPVRLDVLTYLMSHGPATASVCAHAVADTPSNCSYHLRVLGRYGLVHAEASSDGRERPWRATITGFTVEETDAASPGSAETAGVLAASLQLDQRLSRDYLAGRGSVGQEWRAVDVFSTYSLRLSPAELAALAEALDQLIRPYLAATRSDAPADAETVHLGMQAFPRRYGT